MTNKKMLYCNIHGKTAKWAISQAVQIEDYFKDYVLSLSVHVIEDDKK